MGKNIYELIQDALGIDANNMGTMLAKHRMVPLHGRINSEMASGLFHTMAAMEILEIAPITLLIDSGGGDIDAGEFIIEGIRMLNSPITGLVMGQAGSMAIDVLLSCKKRIGLPNSRYFMHFPRKNFDIICGEEVSKRSSVEAIALKIRQGKLRQEQWYADRMKKPVKEVRRLLRLGEGLHLHYRAEEALKLGIIEEIKTDFKLFPLPVKQITSDEL